MSSIVDRIAAAWTVAWMSLREDEGAEFLEVALWSIGILAVGAFLAGIFRDQLAEIFDQIRV